MIDEREVVDLLRAAGDDIAVWVPPAQQLAAAGSKRRRRLQVVATVATAAALAGFVLPGGRRNCGFQVQVVTL